MFNKGKQRFRNLSIFLIVMLLIGQSMPSLAFAKSNSDKGQTSSQTFVQSDLLEAFDEDKFVSYIVVLEDQADTDEVARKIDVVAQKEDYSSATKKEKKQEAVVSSLIEKAETTQADLEAYLKQAKKDEDVTEYRNFYIVNGFSVKGNQESVETIAQYPEVKSILVDGEQKLVPPEEKRSEEGQVLADDEEVEWNVDRMSAPDVWERGFDGEGIVVANIDSGVDWAHPALKEKYRGYDPDNPDDPDHEFNWHDATSDIGIPVDSDGHGTHTMGTMVGQEPDGTNKIGVAPGAQWITVRA
ncbi:MAG TPA: S8 family serine peptidase, partial [Bacillota bacterium]|nr:S8 family serine peptidase [Bacillota bacterium]